MKCPKCGYHSFEHLDACKKCSSDLTGFKVAHKIVPVIMAQAGPSIAQGNISPAARLAEPPAAEDDFLTDNPAIIASAGTTATTADVNAFGEFSFDEEPQPATGNEPAAWDSLAGNTDVLFGETKVDHDLPDLFGDQTPKG